MMSDESQDQTDYCLEELSNDMKADFFTGATMFEQEGDKTTVQGAWAKHCFCDVKLI